MIVPLDTTLDKWPGLLASNRNWLCSVVYARVRCWDAVEEVLQETALAATQKGDPATDQVGISRWLYRVAIRQSLLYLRKSKRHQRKVEFLSQEGNSVVPETPLQLFMACEQQSLVRKGLDCLSSRECEILLLKYSEGWSCADMATRFGVSETAVKSRLLRARKNLRRHLLRFSQDWECDES